MGWFSISPFSFLRNTCCSRIHFNTQASNTKWITKGIEHKGLCAGWTFLSSKTWNLKSSKNLTLSEQQDPTSGKFHTWPSQVAHSQNTGSLKIWYKITFRRGGQGGDETEWISCLDLISISEGSLSMQIFPKWKTKTQNTSVLKPCGFQMDTHCHHSWFCFNP